MKHDRMKTTVLSVKMIPNADKMLRDALNLREDERSLGLLTTDCDDVSYAALDEATKKAEVRVAYARSMYAGAGNASTKLAGEFIGILAGRNPAEVKSGLDAAIMYIERDACFYSANDEDSIVYFAHCISRTGSYLSSEAGVPEGTAMAYLIAPPLEAMVGLDAALKAAQVELKVFYGPPSETNFAGGLLTGDQAACKAACEAFAETVNKIADQPLIF
ncbi:MAG: ethanolamine utilization microcompartment protein EutL [Frisingicoccus sp.]|uniref:ethanolamine utilization microcompartment protein EutL n=1 Tax=Frisingicoccus sp. TaxID=1918627 RepID=UPI0026148DC4|nr:ethanolamine utilization microcompartment protein EutL [Frisingicoccus sp.]MDD6233174.1 ethanolamine utilization microcompartment protein EutL [Frisingicoccus sp.]